MAKKDDPTQKFLVAIQKYQAFLQRLLKAVFKKVFTFVKTVVTFVKKLIAEAGKLAATIGKSALDQLKKLGPRLMNMAALILNMLKAAIRLGQRLVSMIKKGADPNKVIQVLKKLFASYVRMMKDLFVRITEFLQILDLIGAVLKVVDNVKRVLQMIFAWITEVSGAKAVVTKSTQMLKKVMTEFKKELREAEKLRGEAMKLKPTG